MGHSRRLPRCQHRAWAVLPDNIGSMQNYAVAGAPQASPQEAPTTLGSQSLTLPERSYGAKMPAGVDPEKYVASLPAYMQPGARAQQAQQAAEQQQQLLTLSKEQREEASAQLEQSAKGFYGVMMQPEANRPQAWQQELQRQISSGIMHPQQVGTEIPLEYPGPQGCRPF
jgi:vancomycin resistance protein YoaR